MFVLKLIFLKSLAFLKLINRQWRTLTSNLHLEYRITIGSKQSGQYMLMWRGI